MCRRTCRRSPTCSRCSASTTTMTETTTVTATGTATSWDPSPDRPGARAGLFFVLAARHDQVADVDLHRLAFLVQRRDPDLHHALRGARFRRTHLEHLDLEVKLVSRADGKRPAELVEAGADDAARGPELALDEQAHGERRGVPAARREPAENRAARRLLIEMERLGVEFSGETLDLLLLDPHAPGAVFLPGGEILQIFFGHARAYSVPADS